MSTPSARTTVHLTLPNGDEHDLTVEQALATIDALKEALNPKRPPNEALGRAIRKALAPPVDDEPEPIPFPGLRPRPRPTLDKPRPIFPQPQRPWDKLPWEDMQPMWRLSYHPPVFGDGVTCLLTAVGTEDPRS